MKGSSGNLDKLFMYKDLRQRTFNFAVSIAKLILQLPNNAVNKAYFGQIIRGSSSMR